MYKYQISDKFTTADIGLEVTGDSLAELFVGAAEGMFAVIMGPAPRGETSRGTENLRLADRDIEQLLVDWLSELLYRFDVEGKIPQSIELKVTNERGEFALNAGFEFVLYDEASQQAEHEIKAVTYYMLKIEEGADGFKCQVVFDL